MGGSQSRRDDSFKASEWQEVHDTEIANVGDGQYSVVRNRVTGELLDRYLLQFPNEQQYNKYMESVSYRRSQPNIVRIIHYEPKVVKEFCGSAFMLNVYLEHCRSRLSQYEDIPFPDYLYCAMAMLDGYKKLYNKIGRFYVSEHQVMIDDEGEVRVWLNSDFSENQAQDLRASNNFNGSNDQQFQMVDDIMKMIFQNSDEAEGPRLKLVDYYEREKNNYNNRVGFQEAKNIILDYSKLNNIQIPDIFKSVYEIYQSQEGKMHDALAFKNQLLDNQVHQEQQNLHRVGAPVRESSYQPIQSTIQPSQAQTSGNYSPRNGGFLRDGSHSVMPNLISTLPAPGPTFQIRPPANQRAFGPVNQSIQPRFMNQQQSALRTNPFQPNKFAPSAIRHGPSSLQPAQGFPITIRPANNSSHISIGPARGPAPVSSYPPPQHIMNHVPLYHSNQITPINSRPPVNVPLPFPHQNINAAHAHTTETNKRQFVKKADSLPGNFSHEASGPAYVGRDKKIKAELGQQQLEIEKNIIMKTGNASTSQHEYINEANIIRDLSQLHKIQEQQKSKRSAIQEQSSRNNSPSRHEEQYEDDKEYGYHQKYIENNSSRQMMEIKQTKLKQGMDNKMQNNNHYYEFEQGQNMFRQQSQQQHNGHKEDNHNYQSENEGRNFSSQPVYGQKISFNNQASPRFVQQSPSLPQQNTMGQGQNQYYSGFNPHVNSQNQKGQAPPALTQFNSIQFSQNTGISQNQMTFQSAANNQNITNNQNISQQNANRSAGRKQFYYTLSNQIQLDPQIAADMALYVKS